MIIGFQLEDKHGIIGSPNTVLSEPEAISQLDKLKERNSTQVFKMVAVMAGDIEEPFYECPLAATADQYKTLCASVSHIPEDEHAILDSLAKSSDCNMIMGRDTGWFVKLYDEPELNVGYSGMGEEFHSFLCAAAKAGFRLVDFDCDATTHDELPTF